MTGKKTGRSTKKNMDQKRKLRHSRSFLETSGFTRSGSSVFNLLCCKSSMCTLDNTSANDQCK